MGSLLEEAVVDAIIVELESGRLLPSHLSFVYTDDEWLQIEAFHRLSFVDGILVSTKDKWPFIRLHVLGISVSLGPEIHLPETIH